MMPTRWSDPGDPVDPTRPPDLPGSSPFRPGGWMSENPTPVEIPGLQGFVDLLQRLVSAVPTPNVDQGQMAGFGSSRIGPQEAAALDADMQKGGADQAGPGPSGWGAIGPAQWFGHSVPAPSKAPSKTATPTKTPTVAGVAGAGAGGGTAATGATAPAPAKAPPTPSATGWEEEFYRTHGRFPSEWDYADKLWSVDFAQKTGQSPTRQDWVNHAKQNVYNPARPATPEFAPGFGLDTGFGPNRPAPMSAVPAEVQVPGMEKGKRWEKATGPARTGAPTAPTALEQVPKGEGTWGQLIPESWSTDTTNQAFGQWLAEGGSGEPDDWATHLQAIGAGG